MPGALPGFAAYRELAQVFSGLPEPPPSAWMDSLSLQAAALDADIEYHLLANHLLKNGKALVCSPGRAARAGGGALPGAWSEIVLAEADEQVLPDGGISSAVRCTTASCWKTTWIWSTCWAATVWCRWRR
ncbi:MAG: hypothetical protein R3F24_05855 [Gammaproteobacteria bacterium]